MGPPGVGKSTTSEIIKSNSKDFLPFTYSEYKSKKKLLRDILKASRFHVPILDTHPSIEKKGYIIGLIADSKLLWILKPIIPVVLIEKPETLIERIVQDKFKQREKISRTLTLFNEVFMLGLALKYSHTNRIYIFQNSSSYKTANDIMSLDINKIYDPFYMIKLLMVM